VLFVSCNYDTDRETWAVVLCFAIWRYSLHTDIISRTTLDEFVVVISRFPNSTYTAELYALNSVPAFFLLLKWVNNKIN